MMRDEKESDPLAYRILIVIPYFYPYFSGAERQWFEISSRLIRKGYKISILTQKLDGVPEYEEIEGMRIYRKIQTIPVGFLYGLSYIFSILTFLLQYRRDYDIIQCSWLSLHLLPALLMRKLFKKKVIVRITCTGEYGDITLIRQTSLGKVILKGMKNIEKAIATSEEACKELESIGVLRENIIKIPNGVDLKKFIPSEKKVQSETILFVGRLDKQKGLEYLIRAFTIVRIEHPTACLIILGKGPLRDSLLKLGQQLDIQNHIEFLGFKDDILPYYHSARVLVLPSLSEGMPNALLEAMACGVPIVATRIPGNVDLIKNGVNGILVEPFDAQALAHAILTIFNDKALEAGLRERSRDIAEKNFSLEKTEKQYIELYSDIMTK